MDDVLERAKKGDRAAMEELLAQLSPSVHRFGRHMCKNAADADDVLQDTLLAIAKHLPEYEGRSALSSWVFALARSACARRRRGLKNQPALGDEALADKDAPDASPEDSAAKAELGTALTRALDRMPEDYREVLLLRDIEGMTAPEAAAVLGVSVDALKSRLHRARSALRESLAPFLGAAPEPAPGCPDVVTFLSRKLEDDVTPADCAEMERHLAGCRACTGSCDTLRQMLAACRRTPGEVPPGVRDRIKAAVDAWAAELRG